MGMPFLSARWQNLLLVTWAVPPALLERRLPPGLKLDLRGDTAFVSLVAFDFLDTRVLGIPWPGFRNFPEVNLRFYVRHGEQRGVMFVREFVPSRLVCLIARALYNEPYYSPARMSRKKGVSGGLIQFEHRLRHDGMEHRLRIHAERGTMLPSPDSLEHFLKEHQWGFGVSRSGGLLRYEVQHPQWRIHPVVDHQLSFDFARLYGPEFAILDTTPPISCILAVGSPVTVYLGRGLDAAGMPGRGVRRRSPLPASRES